MGNKPGATGVAPSSTAGAVPSRVIVPNVAAPPCATALPGHASSIPLSVEASAQVEILDGYAKDLE